MANNAPPTPGTQLSEDLRRNAAAAGATGGGFHPTGKTWFLMFLIAGGLFVAYVLVIKKKSTATATPTTQDASTLQPTSGQQPAAFSQIFVTTQDTVTPPPVINVSEPVTINNPAPASGGYNNGGPILVAPSPTPAPAPAPTPAPASHGTVTVQTGNTLSGLFGANWPAAYLLNKGVIDQQAIAHHLPPDSEGGVFGYERWIFPGEVLQRP